MFRQVLSKNQQALLPLVRHFSKDFGLVGGTAIALQLGHRQSIDFDLFKNEELDLFALREQVKDFFPIERVMIENSSEFTFSINEVQLTFLNYPFQIEYSEPFEDVIKMPSLVQLAAMKAFALNKRAKWKDYVDLFFIFQHLSLQEVMSCCSKIYHGEFSEKLFREQLSYFADIDYSEEIVYLSGRKVSNIQIQEKLVQLSLE